jgi:hypothetical protein
MACGIKKPRIVLIFFSVAVSSLYAQYSTRFLEDANPFELDLQVLAQPVNFKETQELLVSGVDVNDQDGHLKTLMHYAAECEHNELLEELLTRGADPNVQDEDGNTPFHSVLLKGNLQAVQIVASHIISERRVRFNCALKNNEGLTLLGCAKRCQRFFQYKAKLYRVNGKKFADFSLHGEPPFTTYCKNNRAHPHALLFKMCILGRWTWVIPHAGMFFCLIDKFKKLRAWSGWVYADPFPIIQLLNYLEQQERVFQKKPPLTSRRRALRVEIAETVDAMQYAAEVDGSPH